MQKVLQLKVSLPPILELKINKHRVLFCVQPEAPPEGLLAGGGVGLVTPATGAVGFYILLDSSRCLPHVLFLAFETNFLESMSSPWVSNNSISESLFLWRKIQLSIVGLFCQLYKIQNLR